MVADSQPIFRYGLRRLLDDTEHFRVVGEVDDAEQATEAVRQLEADVLVTSPASLRDGLATLRTLDGLPRPVRCIVVTNGDRRTADGAGWPLPVVTLSRHSPPAAFLASFERVMHQCATNREPCAGARAVDATPARPAPHRLTPREVQIVCALADGTSNKDIGAQLSIAEDTVKRHLSNIFNKVGVDSRMELTVFALYHGLVEWM